MIAMISAVVVQALLVEGFHDANYSTVQNYQFGCVNFHGGPSHSNELVLSWV